MGMTDELIKWFGTGFTKGQSYAIRDRIVL
jgi:hypothetical protein